MSVPIPNINTKGIIPYECAWRLKGELFIVKGRICGDMLPMLYGKAYRYADFPWPEGVKKSMSECRRIAKHNQDRNLWHSDELFHQFQKIIIIENRTCSWSILGRVFQQLGRSLISRFSSSLGSVDTE